MTVEEEMITIRKELRGAMNGVTSTYMRNSGLHYGMNFGASLPDIRRIAALHHPDAALSKALWKADVREMKILATMLCPVEELSWEDAMQWCRDCPNQEISDYLCEMLQAHPQAMDLIQFNFTSDLPLSEYMAFMLTACVCAHAREISDAIAAVVLQRGRTILDRGASKEQRAVLSAWKRWGRLSQRDAARVLEVIADYSRSGKLEEREYFADLKFEFDYYRE